MKKVQYEIGNGKLTLNVCSAPCEVTLVKVTATSDEAVVIVVEVPSRKREDFMDWCVDNRVQFILSGHSWTDDLGKIYRGNQRDAEEVYGRMMSTDITHLDR